MALTPLDANATRIEYYATVADPPCEFNFVPSGLGYCDISVGSGVEAPYSELINVSLRILFFSFCVFWAIYVSCYKKGIFMRFCSVLFFLFFFVLFGFV